MRRVRQPVRGVASATATLLPLLLLLLLLLGGSVAHAFPFAASSGVTELTPATLDAFVQNTHKPVMVLFYAPWCGHCKRLHPDYAQLARQMKGIARIGALDADAHKSVAARYGVRGFPTLKVWPALQRKRLLSPDDYAGPRTVAAMQRYLLSSVRTDGVRRVHDEAALAAALRAAPSRKAVVLFTEKASVPPLLAVLAQSPRLRLLTFVMASGGAGNAVASAHAVTRFPTIAVLRLRDSDADGNGDKTDDGGAHGVAVLESTYTGKIVYEPIAKYLVAALDDADKGSADNNSASNKAHTTR